MNLKKLETESSDEHWEVIADFTEIDTEGVPLARVLESLHSIARTHS